MKSKIEKHISSALSEVKSYYVSNGSKAIKKEYKGYLSSLGASIIMSGLLPTLAVYYNKESNADRTEVINWVFNIIRPIHNNFNINNRAANDLLEYAISIRNNELETKKLIENILNVSIALKLSLRTFPLTK